MKHERRLNIITQFINHKNQQINASQEDKPCLIRLVKKTLHIKLMLKQMAQIGTILLCTVLKHKNFFRKYLIFF